MSLELERIAVAVQACPAVAGLHGGAHDSIGTITARGRLIGISVHVDTVVIGVVGRYPAGVAAIAAQVRAAVAEHAPGYRIVVSVEDLHVPDQHGPSITPAAGPVPAGHAAEEPTPPAGLPTAPAPSDR